MLAIPTPSACWKKYLGQFLKILFQSVAGVRNAYIAYTPTLPVRLDLAGVSERPAKITSVQLFPAPVM